MSRSYEHDRYVPRAYSKDGPGWGVFDRKEQRFVDGELEQIGLERLKNEKLSRPWAEWAD